MKKQYINTIISLIIIIAVSIFFKACKKVNNADSPPPPPPPPPATVTASVAGLVTDINNNPVSNANVSAGSSATTTDINGSFTIRDVQLIKDDGFVKVVKTGYFDGSRTFLVNANTTNNVKIKLIPKTASGNFAAASGGTINVTGGGAIDFSSGSIVNATSGTAYAGNVSVSNFYLNPTDPNFKEYMPGDLRGINTNNKELILHSFGMIAVEMNDAGGQKLQLAASKTATITIPIPSAMQSSAPATISLWWFDETSGIWKEEGTATKQTTNYVGTVKHFSFWNAGELVQDVRLDATFKNDSSGSLPLVNKLVTVTSVNYGTRNAYTDNSGKASGLVPAGENLVMKVFSDCGRIIYTSNIGPFSTNTDLGNISIAGGNETLVSVTVTGNAVNCSNTPVIHGSVRLTMGSDNYNAVINNGSFSLAFNRCSNSFTPATLIAYDSITNQSGNPITKSVVWGSQNIGQISACNPSIPVANFYFSSGHFVPATATFINTSANAISYLWNFGDGTTSTLVNPVHIYTTAGDFTVTLTATGSGGTNSITKTVHVFNAASDAYITLTINGTSYSWLPPDELYDSSYNNSPFMLVGNTTSAPVKYILCVIYNNNTVSPGNYPFSLYTRIDSTVYNTNYPNNNPQTSVTEFGPVGGYITGSASGWIKNSSVPTTDSLAFSCTYRIKRIQ